MHHVVGVLALDEGGHLADPVAHSGAGRLAVEGVPVVGGVGLVGQLPGEDGRIVLVLDARDGVHAVDDHTRVVLVRLRPDR